MDSGAPTTGEHIRTLRTKRGWTQDDVARRVGVKPLAVGKWERDQANPTAANLVELARVFGVDARELGYEPPVWTPEQPPEWAELYHAEIMHRLDEYAARLALIESCLCEEVGTVKSLEEHVIAYIKQRN
jgi:transcriptional regulator with XRE-family HTH domain